MTFSTRRVLPVLAVVMLSGWIAAQASAPGDYGVDAGPAVSALSQGHLSAFLAAHPDMGPVSILLRAPFAAVADGELAAYRWGAFACLLAAGLLGLYLAQMARRRGVRPSATWLIAALCLINPLTFAALDAGHPEEVLTAALAVGAVAAASQDHRWRAALLLGLAIGCKQWAVIATLPVLMALPAGRLRAVALAAAVAIGLTLPGLIADPGGFLETQRSLAVESQYVTPWSAWYPGSSATPVHSDAMDVTIHPHYASGLVARVSHPLIVLSAFLVPLALAVRRRSFSLDGGDAMALLALLALLRCLLDPVDNIYYHAPLLLALAGWDALADRGLPLRALTGAALLELLSRWSSGMVEPAAFNAMYLVLAAGACALIATALLRTAQRRAGGPIFGSSTVSPAPPLART